MNRLAWMASEARGRTLHVGQDFETDGTFDSVVLVEGLEVHAKLRELWLRAVRSVAPGGRLIGTARFGAHRLRELVGMIAESGRLTHLDVHEGDLRFVMSTAADARAVDTSDAALLSLSEAAVLASQREVDATKRKYLELQRSFLVTESLLSSLRAQTSDLESVRNRLRDLESATTPSEGSSPAMRGFAAFLGSLQRELNTGGFSAAPLDALRKTYARVRRAASDAREPRKLLGQPAAPYVPLVIDWAGAMKVVPLYFCANHDGERITVSGTAVVEQKDRAASYLTHVPAVGMSRRAESSPSIPDDEVELSISVEVTGLDVSLWIVEFHGEQQVAKTAWATGALARWKPHRDCDSIRIGLRLQGSGSLEGARIELRERGHEAKQSEHLLRVWRALNAPKSELTNVVAHECATHLGPEPEVLTQTAAATHSFLLSHAIDASTLVLDGGALVGEIDRGVWKHQQQALVERAYSWSCPFTGASIRSTDTFIVSEPAGFAYVFVRFESAGHVFFLILCPFRSSRVGVYFPAVELVVSRLKLGTLVRGFRSLAVRNADQFRRYLTTTEPRQTTVPINTLRHWGHVVLNEIEALQWLFDTGTDANVDHWLKGEIGFFNFDELFPVPQAKLHHALSPDERFRWCLQHDALIIHPQIASYYLGEQAGTRLVEMWRREGERTGALSAICSKLEGHYPVIWCEIRANDRLWKNQLEGLKAIVDTLKPVYPNMALVLAGWSRMLKPSAGDEKMIALETKVIEHITETLTGTTCLPALGVPTGEKMLWALSCHFHISIVGSGLLFALLAKLPGVTLVSRYYQENELFLADDKRRVNYMYGVDRLVVLPTRFVIDDASISNGEIRDFSVNAPALADFVKSELAKLVHATS